MIKGGAKWQKYFGAGTEEEILKKAAEHAQTAHNMKEITKEVAEKVRAAIHDE